MKTRNTPNHALITGFPRLEAKYLASRLLARNTRQSITLLVEEAQQLEAQEFLSTFERPKYTRILVGDVAALDLGLSGAEATALAPTIHYLYHFADLRDASASPRDIRRANVDGTQHILTFAEECPHLQRLVFASSAFVSGDRVGVILEDELEEGQRFQNTVEESKYEAEQRVRRAWGRIPTTIVRPSIVVGDSKTGEIDPHAGPYYTLLMQLLTPRGLPMVGDGKAPLHLVPVDFVVDACIALAQHPEAQGKCFHLTDPNPLSHKRILGLVSERVGKKSTRGQIPLGLTKLLMRTPGLKQRLRAPRQALSYLGTFSLYNNQHLLALLGPSGICPSFESYLDVMLQFVKGQQDEDREPDVAEEETLEED